MTWQPHGPPLAVNGPLVTTRKFSRSPIHIAKLIELGSVSKNMAQVLVRPLRQCSACDRRGANRVQIGYAWSFMNAGEAMSEKVF